MADEYSVKILEHTTATLLGVDRITSSDDESPSGRCDTIIGGEMTVFDSPEPVRGRGSRRTAQDEADIRVADARMADASDEVMVFKPAAD